MHMGLCWSKFVRLCCFMYVRFHLNLLYLSTLNNIASTHTANLGFLYFVHNTKYNHLEVT